MLDGRPQFAPLRDACVLTTNEHIEWVGPASACPPLDADAWQDIDLGGRWVTPGLIDCHTHLIFGGHRAAEHALRARGASYEDIAAAGGGILSTMRATRAANDEALFAAACARLEALRREGVTALEVKSGYGLDFANEERLLRLARRLERDSGLRVHASFLGAHALPPEFAGRADDYIDTLARDWLPRLAEQRLIDSVDIYCESLAFDTAQAGRLFDAAQRLELPVRMHAEQRSNIGGTRLAAARGALSVDHLEYAGDAEVEALARAGTVAVLLPVAWLVLRETRRPPIESLRRAGVPVAVASDCNPGTAPGESLLLAMHLAAREFGLTPPELLAGVSLHAARALGWQTERGRLAAGFAADLAVWDIDSADEFGYWIAHNACAGTIVAGRPDRRLAALLGRERTP